MPEIDEQEARDYLAGKLSPQREAELHALRNTEADVNEEFLALEEELYDQYLAGALPEPEKQYFETHFLSTASGKEKLHFAAIFGHYREFQLADELSAGRRAPAPLYPPIPPSSPLFATFTRNPAFTVLAIVIAGLLVTLMGWLYANKSGGHHPAGLAAVALELNLSPGSVKSGETIKNLAAPAKTDRVKILLELSNSDFKKYRTQLVRENKILESQEELQTESRSSHYVVPVTFAGATLIPGDYQLKLSGVPDSGQPTYIDSYAFRVTTEPPLPVPSDSDLQRDPQRDELAR
jgi:hypothetical protein